MEEEAVSPSARERLLDAAERRFEGDGIAATGINDLIAEADVARMTLYNHFASKDDLVVEYLRRRDADWRARLERRLESAIGPREAMLELLHAYGDRVDREGFRGCPFVNAAAELPPDHPGWRVITEHKQAVVDALARLATELGVADPEDLAMQLFLLAEGAIVTAGRERSTRPIEDARRAAATLIDAAPRG